MVVSRRKRGVLVTSGRDTEREREREGEILVGKVSVVWPWRY